MTAGRPSKFTQSLADEIYERLCNGETFAKICESPHMPTRQNLWIWRVKNPEFRDMITTCLQIKGEVVVDSMDDIESKMERGEIEPAAGNAILTNRRWKASKFYSRVFGDKTQIDQTSTNVNLNAEIQLSDADLAILKRSGFTDID